MACVCLSVCLSVFFCVCVGTHMAHVEVRGKLSLLRCQLPFNEAGSLTSLKLVLKKATYL